MDCSTKWYEITDHRSGFSLGLAHHNGGNVSVLDLYI